MKKLLLTARILSCTCLVLATAILSTAADNVRESQEDDIREAVFRHQFEHNASGQQQTAHDYYLAIGDKDADPSDAFMKRFVHHKPAVHKASACRVLSKTGEVVNKGSEKRGLLFRVAAIKWISDTEVRALGGYDEGNLSSSGNTYTVKKENGKWVVTSDHLDVISTNIGFAKPS